MRGRAGSSPAGGNNNPLTEQSERVNPVQGDNDPILTFLSTKLIRIGIEQQEDAMKRAWESQATQKSPEPGVTGRGG